MLNIKRSTLSLFPVLLVCIYALQTDNILSETLSQTSNHTKDGSLEMDKDQMKTSDGERLKEHHLEELKELRDTIKKVEVALEEKTLMSPYQEIFLPQTHLPPETEGIGFGPDDSRKNTTQDLDRKVDSIMDLMDDVQKTFEVVPDPASLQGMYKRAMEILDSGRGSKPDALRLLLDASNLGHSGAKSEVAWATLLGSELPQDVLASKDMFQGLADEGVAEGHCGLGFLHSAGLGVNASQARALVHYTIAALGGSDWARMALGVRYWFGITVSADCEKALHLYKAVSTRVAAQVTSSGGKIIYRIRLQDEAEDPAYQSVLIDRDLRQYYEMLAEQGDVGAQLGLAQMHFKGSRGFKKDLTQAMRYFKLAAALGSPLALGYIGKMYFDGGETVEQDLAKAYTYAKHSADLGSALGQAILGQMYLEGKHVERDLVKAVHYTTLSADQGWVDGLLHMGILAFQGVGMQKDLRMAKRYLTMAAQAGNLAAYHSLGLMHAHGYGTLRSCPTAVELLKSVAERGRWGRLFNVAYALHRGGRRDEAYVHYALLAELGYEVGQANAAYLLERDLFSFASHKWTPSHTMEDDHYNEYRQALTYWSRAAQQGYGTAFVKLGDYHFYGKATEVDHEMSAAYYRLAFERHLIAQAAYNLGYMHEHGLGLKRDTHLAKRCYDMAAIVSRDAEIPVWLTQVKIAIVDGFQTLMDVWTWDIFKFRLMNFLFGPYWDVYFCVVLCLLLISIIYTRVFRRDLVEDIFN